MIKSGAKVTLDKTDEGTVVTILPDTSTAQQGILGGWAIVWVFSGILALVGGLKEMNNDERTFLFVFMGFWVYFLFYAVRSLIWIRTGAEYLRIGEEKFDYKRSWNGYGKVKSYDLGTIKNLGVVNYEDKKFAQVYHDAFWTIGGEKVGFEYFGRKVAVGFKLDEAQAKRVVVDIQKAMKEAKRSES